MLRDSRLTGPWLLTLLCFMLLVVRVGGAHLHLCFDGGEPPSSFHLIDHGLHHGAPGMDAEHQDVDVTVTDDALAKFAKLDLDLSALLLAALVSWRLLRAPRQPAPEYRDPSSRPAARSLRPPLRGPPLLTSPKYP